MGKNWLLEFVVNPGDKHIFLVSRLLAAPPLSERQSYFVALISDDRAGTREFGNDNLTVIYLVCRPVRGFAIGIITMESSLVGSPPYPFSVASL